MIIRVDRGKSYKVADMTGHPGLLRLNGSALAAPLLAGLALGIAALIAPALAQPTPPDPASAQPSLPKPLDGGMPLTSPILGGGKTGGSGASDKGSEGVRRAAVPAPLAHRRSHTVVRHRIHHYAYAEPLERPALAGVELVAPIPVPVQPPHFTVQVPAYLPENAATFYTTPLPPVVCHRVRRDPYAPDPHLIRETTVLCEADNP